jgi:hypothetical protein
MTEINLQELSENILKRYTPFAFLCECKGTEPTCSQSRQDAYTFAQYDTIQRVAKYISEFNPNH